MSRKEFDSATDGSPDVDFDRHRLMSFLEKIEKIGKLKRVKEETRLSAVAALLDGSPDVVLFERILGRRDALVGNVLSSRERIALAFDTDVHNVAREVLKRLKSQPRVIEVGSAAAPVHQQVLRGDEIDLTRLLPVHLQHDKDGGPYISAGLDFTIDPATGLTNVGVRRFMLRGKSTTGIDLVAPSDLRTMFLASAARGENLPISVVVGTHPIDYFAGAMRMPGDELALIASLRGAPMPVVKCITNDIRVPADAEWVIEGFLGCEGHVEPEGPFGEYLGYYGEMKSNPLFHVTAITKRRDAVFQTISIGGAHMSNTDTAQLAGVRTEVLVWLSLESAVREPVAVYVPPASGGSYNVRIALRQRSEGEARNAIAATFGSLANVKNVFVVDPDIDIFSDEQMEWALATRFQPHRDLVVSEGFRTFPLDPSLQNATVLSKVGFDLTRPFDAAISLKSTVPMPPTFERPRHASVRRALAAGPKLFQDLMAALGSDDGSEVLVELEALRAEGVLDREAHEGCYVLRSSDGAGGVA